MDKTSMPGFVLGCLEAIRRFKLGRPFTSLHPAAAAHGAPPVASGTPLHHLKPGQDAIILGVEHEEPEMLKYLATLGLFPGTKIQVSEVAPFGGPVLIHLGSARYALGRKVAARILVRRG